MFSTIVSKPASVIGCRLFWWRAGCRGPSRAEGGGRVAHVDVHQALVGVGRVDDLPPLVRPVGPFEPDGPGPASDAQDDVFGGPELVGDALLKVHRHTVRRQIPIESRPTPVEQARPGSGPGPETLLTSGPLSARRGRDGAPRRNRGAGSRAGPRRTYALRAPARRSGAVRAAGGRRAGDSPGRGRIRLRLESDDRRPVCRGVDRPRIRGFLDPDGSATGSTPRCRCRTRACSSWPYGRNCRRAQPGSRRAGPHRAKPTQARPGGECLGGIRRRNHGAVLPLNGANPGDAILTIRRSRGRSSGAWRT